MARVRIKICGITRPEDGAYAAARGAHFVGLNFYPSSPRCISEPTAREILAVLPASTEPVALLVDQSWKRAEEVAASLGIAHLQMHGAHRETPPHDIAAFIPAFSIQDASSLTRIRDYLQILRTGGLTPLALLVDAHVPGMHGGTGTTAPWELLANFDPGVPLILAGGLTPENVAQAIRTVRPWGVDVASGVESSPGIKDPEKMRRFIGNALDASMG